MSDTERYTPPKVWTFETENGGKWAGLNRPVAGATHDSALPKGKHPFQLYSMGTPNGVKVTVLFEELLAAGHAAEYDAWLIRIGDGTQFGSGFVEVNPNSKIPALMDYSGAKPVRVFESGAILLHLAEKFGAFLGAPEDRPELLSWLMWQMGSAPYLGGGFGHFYAYAPYPMEYPINRFAMEAKRQMDVLNRHLEGRDWMVGDDLTIADIAICPWYGRLALGEAYDAGEFLSVQEYPNVIAWAHRFFDRPAVQRGRMVNRTFGPADGQLWERHDATDFDTKTQDKVQAAT